jgi:hypothetical protein
MITKWSTMRGKMNLLIGLLLASSERKKLFINIVWFWLIILSVNSPSVLRWQTRESHLRKISKKKFCKCFILQNFLAASSIASIRQNSEFKQE